VDLGYPSEAGEGAIARRYSERREPLDSVPVVADADAIREAREAVRTVRVAGDVEAYLVSLCRATRAHPDLRLGASPRATVALYRASQAWAALDGRRFVLPDDVAAVAPAVLGHRLLLDLDRELAGATAALVLSDVLASVPIPIPTGT
jgi:MoxR-like ATPase